MTAPTTPRYGWVPDKPDKRDLLHEPHDGTTVYQPTDLRATGYLAPVWNQLALGSCTAHGTGAAVCFCRAKEHLPFIMPSRLFIYYNERALEGTTGSDAGAMIRDGMKTLAKQGVCPEVEWPYSDGPDLFKRKPPRKCYTDARKDVALRYLRVQLDDTGNNIKKSLAEGYPVVIGFTVYSEFEQVGADGILPMPGGTSRVLGGHCVLIVGWKLILGQPYWIVRNSWGADWGDSGHFYMPVNYTSAFFGQAQDFWTVRAVGAAGSAAPVTQGSGRVSVFTRIRNALAAAYRNVKVRAQVARFARLFAAALAATGIAATVVSGTASRGAIVAAIIGAAEVAFRQFIKQQ